MVAGKMHADEVEIDAALVRRLLADQFPEWAALPLEPVRSAGTDHAIFRLGEEMCVRLPRIPSAVLQAEKEHRWLPQLAPRLPLAVPVPIARGTPADRYPWSWSVFRWLEGETATAERIADPRRAATDLARFVAALRRIDPAGGPEPGEHNAYRGEPLEARDEEAREALALLGGLIDVRSATTAWETGLRAPAWSGAPVWLHGDLIATNLLAVDGQLSGVIDFGLLGVGDPACDVMAAWTFVAGAARDVFLARLSVDEATLARARGWALSFGLIALPYYRDTNPVLARIARRAIDEVLADGG